MSVFEKKKDLSDEVTQQEENNANTFKESVEMTKAGFLVGSSWLVPHLRFLGPAVSFESADSGAGGGCCLRIFSFRPKSPLCDSV